MTSSDSDATAEADAPGEVWVHLAEARWQVFSMDVPGCVRYVKAPPRIGPADLVNALQDRPIAEESGRPAKSVKAPRLERQEGGGDGSKAGERELEAELAKAERERDVAAEWARTRFDAAIANGKRAEAAEARVLRLETLLRASLLVVRQFATDSGLERMFRAALEKP